MVVSFLSSSMYFVVKFLGLNQSAISWNSPPLAWLRTLKYSVTHGNFY